MISTSVTLLRAASRCVISLSCSILANIGSTPIGCQGIPVSSEGPPLGTLHRTVGHADGHAVPEYSSRLQPEDVICTILETWRAPHHVFIPLAFLYLLRRTTPPSPPYTRDLPQCRTLLTTSRGISRSRIWNL